MTTIGCRSCSGGCTLPSPRIRLALVDRLVAEPADGSLKLYVTRCALRFRREHRALFAKGSYLPLRAAGEKNKHVIAFARSFRGTTVLVLAGRFFAQLGADARAPWAPTTWGDAEVVLRKQLPSGPYRDVFTGKTISPVQRDGEVVLPISEAFSHLPIAMLVNVDGEQQGSSRCRVARPNEAGNFSSAHRFAATIRLSSGSGRRI